MSLSIDTIDTSMSSTNDSDIAKDDVDEESTDIDEVVQECIHNKITKQSYETMLTRAAPGHELLPIIDLLPNSSQHYGRSIMMNAIIKNHWSSFSII